ncbi:hypothetical protein CSA37_08155 [Candidatus Fermentibacteria bacterium]|nr:MAG: hypothetical protein CSA37_08155 [Candidatus Fermentibacteria bacterium]
MLWLAVFAAVAVQFLFEVTLGRLLVAPAILVPVLVYLGTYRDDTWSIEGAFWSGFVLDLLTQHAPGTSSMAMLLGISFSRWAFSVTTGAVQMTFAAKALVASIVSDVLFILITDPVSGFGFRTLLLLPRTIAPLVIFLVIPVIFHGRNNKQKIGVR